MQTIRNEIVEDVMLCDAAGRLNPAARGWSRRPLHRCNLKGRFPRKKKWDYWCVMGPRFLLSATIANVDYAAIGSVYFLEYETKRFAEHNVFKLFSKSPVMPDTVGGDIQFEHNGLALSFRSTETGLRMTVRSDNFEGKRLQADLDIERRDDHETLNVVVPWNESTFQFTSKQHCLPTRGNVRWGDETFTFDNDAFACLDFGRGIWPYRTSWNWASFSGRAGEDVVGINMGARWTDHTGMNENGIVVNGRLYKIFDDISFRYSDKDFMAPWRMQTAGGSPAVDLTLTPFYDKTAATNLLLLSAQVHQLFGYYSGTLSVEGKTIRIEGTPGWAEEHFARW